MIIKNGYVISADGIKVIQDLIPETNKQAWGYPMNVEYITIHNTGNSGASAYSNSQYADKENGYVSWHFTVGKGEVYQELPITVSGWHCGDGANGKGNKTSIGIEIAEVEGAEETAIEFVAQLLLALNMNVDKVVPHKHWSGKNCPRLILPHWNVFIENIKREMNPIETYKSYIQAQTGIDTNTMTFLDKYTYSDALFTKLYNAMIVKKYKSWYVGLPMNDENAYNIIEKSTRFDINTMNYLKGYVWASALLQKLAKTMI